MNGDAVIHSVFYLIIIGIVFWLLWWLVDYVPIPQPFNKVAKVIIAVFAVLICINVLLGLAGHPLITWR